MKISLRSLVVLVVVMGLTACTTVSKQTVEVDVDTDPVGSVIEPAPDQLVEVDLTSEVEADLPKIELDAKTLEQLLLLNFASYQGDWALASASALEAATASNDYRVARTATLLALRDNDYDSAVRGAELWVELRQGSADALNMLLISQVGAGQVDAALQTLSLQGEGKEIDLHIKQVAGLLVRQSNGDAAHEIAKHYVDSYPESAQVMLSSSYVAEVFKKEASAQAWLDKSVALKPDWDLAAQMKADMLRSQGKVEERAEFIAEYVKNHPGSIVMRINHAAELARQEHYQDALDLMQDVLSSAPRDVAALTYAAALAQHLEDNQLAGKYYRSALNEDPNNDDVRWSLARLAFIDKKYLTAERLFNDITAKESYLSAQLQVANARYQTQGIKGAINTLRALEPETEAEYVDIALTRHYLLMQDHEYDEALGYINETLLYLPNNLELLYARALVAAELKKVAIAESDFKAIIARQPTHANALNALGYTLADQTDRYEEAREYIVQALELRPQDGHILDSMGWVAYRLEDFSTAIEFLQRAFEASPETEVAAHLGEVLWESGDRDEARAVWEKSYNEDANNPILNETLKRYGVDFNISVTKQ